MKIYYKPHQLFFIYVNKQILDVIGKLKILNDACKKVYI